MNSGANRLQLKVNNYNFKKSKSRLRQAETEKPNRVGAIIKGIFMNKLFEKRINLREANNVFGGDYSDSGGTETGSTSLGTDTYTHTYNDDCQKSKTTVCFN